MFESSKLHCRLHCLGVEVTNGYRGHVFRLGPCFFLSISQTQLLRMCLFPCEAYDSRKGGQTHHPKKKWKNHEHKPTIPCQTTTCDTMKLRSTPQSEDALMIMSLIVSSPQIENSYPNSYPPHFTWHAPEWTCIGSDGMTEYIMGKRSKASRCEAPKSFYANLLGYAEIFRGRRQGRQPLNIYIYLYIQFYDSILSP